MTRFASFLLLLTVPCMAETIRFRTLCPAPHDAGATLSYLPGPGETAVEVELPAANLSLERYLSKQREIRFFEGDPGPEVEPVAIARIPEPMKDVIMMLLPEARHGRYRVTVFDAEVAAFRGGDLQFVNLSPESVGIELGGEKLALKPGKSGRIRKNLGGGAERHALQFFRQAEDAWERFSATRVTLDPRIRRLVVIYFDPSSARLRARSIQDRVDQDDGDQAS